MDPRRLAPLALVLALAACAPPGAPAAGPATVPFELLPSNHIVVEAALNDKGPYRLIFDLGSPVTLLGSQAAEASGAIPEDAPRSFLFNTRGEGQVETLKIGELVAHDLPVLVMDHPAIKALGEALGKPLHGIVGYTFFARYKTTIDYQARRMTFEPVDFEVRNLAADLPGRVMGPKVARVRVLAPAGLWGLTVAEPAGEHPEGVPVAGVAADSAAAEAGLRPGDLLAEVDGRWTVSVADVYAAAADVPPGQTAPVVVLRDGERLELSLTPRDGI